MPRISVLLPTHEHASTLPYAVRSVQRQGVDDLEILICGDGATEQVRAVVAELMRGDERIRFFDLPKAPARGELNRDYVMRQAKGEFIFHQNDDDLWLPGHVETLERALEEADFVGAIQVNVDTDGKVRAHYFDLERTEFVTPWLDWQPNGFGPWACNGFGPIFVAHRLDAFLRLPEGWVTTAPGLPADQSMWHRFLRQSWCRAKFLRWPVALHFPAPDRQDWGLARRGEELRHWTEIIEAADYAARIWRDIMPDLGDRLLRQSLQEREQRTRLQAEHEIVLARAGELQAQLHPLQLELETSKAAFEREQSLRAAAENKCDAIRLSCTALENERDAMWASCRALETERDAMRASCGALQNEFEALRASYSALESERDTIQASYRASRNECDALRGSRSWRITGPLRLLATQVRKLSR